MLRRIPLWAVALTMLAFGAACSSISTTTPIPTEQAETNPGRPDTPAPVDGDFRASRLTL